MDEKVLFGVRGPMSFVRELDEFGRSLRGSSRVVLSYWERHSSSDYENACSYALYLSKIYGSFLPDSLHYVLLFGPVNHYVRLYFSFCAPGGVA